MSDAHETETVVLTREYLESVHGRMTFFADAQDDDEQGSDSGADNLSAPMTRPSSADAER